jgi:arginine exporter protein ArgO
MKLVCLTLYTVLFFYQSSAMSGQADESQSENQHNKSALKNFSAKSNQWQVEVEGLRSAQDEYGQMIQHLSLSALNTDSSEYSQQTINTMMTTILSIAIYLDRLVVIGSINSSANGVMIVDLQEKKLPEFISLL